MTVFILRDAPPDEQEEKLGKVVVKYEAAIKEVDVKLIATGGDTSKGAPKQKTEITIYTLRNGIVSCNPSLMCCPMHVFLHALCKPLVVLTSWILLGAGAYRKEVMLFQAFFMLL